MWIAMQDKQQVYACIMRKAAVFDIHVNVLNKFIKLIPRQADISGINNPLPKAEIPRYE